MLNRKKKEVKLWNLKAKERVKLQMERNHQLGEQERKKNGRKTKR